MSDLTFLAPAISFTALLNTSSTGGLTNILQVIQDGLGHNSPLSLSTYSININTQMGGGFFIDDVKLDATAEDINDVCLLADFGGLTGALTLPIGTTAERPVAPLGGEIRYNTDSNRGEIFEDNTWIPFSAGPGINRGQVTTLTIGNTPNIIDFPIKTSSANQSISNITISVTENTGLKVAYASSIAAAFWNGVTTASSGALPAIIFTGTAAFGVSASWSISGNNLRLTVTGIVGTNSTWNIFYENLSN